MNQRLWRMAASVLSSGLVAVAAAIGLGQVDNFQDGTTMSWAGGAQPTNIATGGPAGAGDRFLQITASTPAGPGSRIGMFNEAQWTGNYASAGVKVIEVHLRNQGTVPLEMRVVLKGPLGSQWVSTLPNTLPADNTWRRVTFFLLESHMTRTVGSETFQAVIGNVDKLMLRHDEGAPGSGGTPVNSQLGIDNISALAAATVPPTSYTRLTGAQTAGTFADLLASDNSYVRATIDLAAELVNPISYRFESTSPLADPTRLEFSIESGADADGRGMYIELFNFASNRWDLVLLRSLGTTDTVATVSIASGAANYVEPGTRGVQARVTWYEGAAETLDLLDIRIDHVFWAISP